MVNNTKARLLIVVTIFMLFTLSFASVNASSPTISRAYEYNGQIQNGSLVSVEVNQGNIVQASNTNNESRLIGVVVQADDSLLAVNASSSTIQVATYGTAITLVSNLNGTIDVGDQIGPSPFNGVGMKVSNNGRVIGIALAKFTANTPATTKEQVTTIGGKKISIVVGYIPVTISIGSYNVSAGDATGAQKYAYSLLGHPVSNTRLIISSVISIIALASIITLIYSSIYSSIISIGRNPLAKFEVLRTLSSVAGMILILSGISGLAIYFLLR